VTLAGSGACAVTLTYQWNAVYSGDPNNTPVSETGAAAERVTVSFPVPPPPSTTLATLAGPDAIDTAIAVANASFPEHGSAKAAVLARSDFFSDALAGGPLAAALDGPLLITPGGPAASIDPRVLGEIEDVLAPGAVYVLPLALSPAIDTTLSALDY
jgi:hypothetical protein